MRVCVRVLQERTAVVNLTDAYAGSVMAATRHFSLAADYSQLVITDNIIPRSAVDAAATTLTWTMHTYLCLHHGISLISCPSLYYCTRLMKKCIRRSRYANITVDADGRAATLEQDGRQLRATASASTGQGGFQAKELNITSIPSNQSTVFDSSPGALLPILSPYLSLLLARSCLSRAFWFNGRVLVSTTR